MLRIGEEAAPAGLRAEVEGFPVARDPRRRVPDGDGPAAYRVNRNRNRNLNLNRASGGRRRRRPLGPLGDELRQDGQRDLGGGAGAQLQSGRTVHVRTLFLRNVEGGQHDCPPGVAGDESDIGHLGSQGDLQGRLFVTPVRGHDQRRVVRPRRRVCSHREVHVKTERATHRHQGVRHRRHSDDQYPGCRHGRLEEDLDGPAAEARVGHLHGSLLTDMGSLARHNAQ